MSRETTQPTAQPRTSSRRDALATQARLLDAAGRLFASKGYDQTNVREICSSAGANVSAVRHHFGGKEGLYRAVVLHSHRAFFEQAPFPQFHDGDDPETALARAIEHMLQIILIRRARHPYAAQLLANELRSPTGALDEVLQNVMMPVRREFQQIIGTLLGNTDSPRLRGKCANFVIGLCVFHELGKEALKRFGFPPPNRASDVPKLAELVTQFALGGIQRIAESVSGNTHRRNRST